MDNIKEIRLLFKILSPIRAMDDNLWYQLGQCIFDIDSNLFDLWIKFGQKFRDDCDISECALVWNRMEKTNYTMRTLRYFANKDDPVTYSKLLEPEFKEARQHGMEGSHNTIAKLLAQKYKFQFVCASVKHNIWYQFVDHKWIKIDNAYTIRNLISDELASDYGKWQSELYESSKQAEGYEKARLIDNATTISKTIKSLGDSIFKNYVIQEYACMVYDPEFLNKLDENIGLICFKNGVYDLKNNYFRDGYPDDYISLCTGYDYSEDTKDNMLVDEIKNYFSKLFPDTDTKIHVIKLLRNCIRGSHNESNLHTLLGSGSNSKSIFMQLIKYLMGDYFFYSSSDILVKSQNNCIWYADRILEFSNSKGKRVHFICELNCNTNINLKYLEEFNNKQQTQMLTGEKFKPQFKSFLVTNYNPFTTAEPDTTNKIQIIDFKSVFTKENRDFNLDKILVKWAPVLMTMLLDNVLL